MKAIEIWITLFTSAQTLTLTRINNTLALNYKFRDAFAQQYNILIVLTRTQFVNITFMGTNVRMVKCNS